MYNHSVALAWPAFRSIVDARVLVISYVQRNGNYYLFIEQGTTQWTCTIATTDASEFETSYLASATNLE